MVEMTQIQRMYSAIVIRGTRSVPTFAEVASDARREVVDRASIESDPRF